MGDQKDAHDFVVVNHDEVPANAAAEAPAEAAAKAAAKAAWALLCATIDPLRHGVPKGPDGPITVVHGKKPSERVEEHREKESRLDPFNQVVHEKPEEHAEEEDMKEREEMIEQEQKHVDAIPMFGGAVVDSKYFE